MLHLQNWSDLFVSQPMHDYWTVSYFISFVSVIHFLFCVSYWSSLALPYLPVAAYIALILSILLTYGENKWMNEYEQGRIKAQAN